jgi:hypothetical protein
MLAPTNASVLAMEQRIAAGVSSPVTMIALGIGAVVLFSMLSRGRR